MFYGLKWHTSIGKDLWTFKLQILAVLSFRTTHLLTLVYKACHQRELNSGNRLWFIVLWTFYKQLSAWHQSSKKWCQISTQGSAVREAAWKTSWYVGRSIALIIQIRHGKWLGKERLRHEFNSKPLRHRLSSQNDCRFPR